MGEQYLLQGRKVHRTCTEDGLASFFARANSFVFYSPVVQKLALHEILPEYVIYVCMYVHLLPSHPSSLSAVAVY